MSTHSAEQAQGEDAEGAEVGNHHVDDVVKGKVGVVWWSLVEGDVWYEVVMTSPASRKWVKLLACFVNVKDSCERGKKCEHLRVERSSAISESADGWGEKLAGLGKGCTYKRMIVTFIDGEQ